MSHTYHRKRSWCFFAFKANRFFKSNQFLSSERSKSVKSDVREGVVSSVTQYQMFSVLRRLLIKISWLKKFVQNRKQCFIHSIYFNVMSVVSNTFLNYFKSYILLIFLVEVALPPTMSIETRLNDLTLILLKKKSS